ncbi:MAG: hypothetical protein ABSC23_11305 [Bryobacteraceae bacterium]|jgi:hypothetical protein
MNFELIGHLIGLRYKLLWAKTRTRNGKIAMFMAGYLLLVLVVAFFAVVGAGGGMVAVRSGKVERVAQGALTSLFLCALATSVVLGFGVNAAFSDVQLRRYPLNARERRFARHFTGIVDPFWFLFLALDLGLAFGLYLFGESSLLLGLVAILLLFVCNYLTAQVVGLTLDRIMQQKGGSIILPIALTAVCILPGALTPVLRKHPAAIRTVVQVLGCTPSFGAGSLMTRTDVAALSGLALLAGWMLGLTAALVALERRPPRVRTEQTSHIQWDTPLERAGALFGPQYGPLATHWLQFLFRCRRFKLAYLMSLPLLPFLLLIWTRQVSVGRPSFAAAVGVFAVAGMAPASAFIVNQFGYVGSGFRRYFLFPMDPAAVLRASSYTLLALCSVYVALATLAWMLFGPAGYGVRGLVMLVAGGVFGLFAFHGAGLWTTLYGPRRCDPNKTMGNDLSLAANIVVVGGMMTMLMGPMIVGRVWKQAIAPSEWWGMVLLAALAACFYFASLRRATATLSSRRERLLAALEGRA